MQSVQLCKVNADEGLLLGAAGSLSLFYCSLSLFNGGLRRSGSGSRCRCSSRSGSRRCCGSGSLRLGREFCLGRLCRSSSGCAYYFVALDIERALDRLEHLVNTVVRNERDKEALVHDLLCSFGVGFNICRFEFQLLAGVPDGVYQQECAEVLHLAAVLEEYADGGLVVCRGSGCGGSCTAGCGSLRVGSRAGSDSFSLRGGIALGFTYQCVARL